MENCMGWTQVITIVGANLALIIASFGTTVGLFLWARSEASEDRREAAKVASEDRRDLLQISRDIQNEIKDFHAKLIMLEKERMSK